MLSRKFLQELHETESMKENRRKKKISDFLLEFTEKAKLKAKTQYSYTSTITAERCDIISIHNEITILFIDCDVSKLVIYTGECGNYADIQVRWN